MKKIHIKFMQISAVAIVVTAVCALFLFYNILRNQIFDDLRADAHMISMMDLQQFPQKSNVLLKSDELRITLIAADGTVTYDSVGDKSVMENHADREEIIEAFRNGEGRAMRLSATSLKHTFYYAALLEDGRVLRIGKESNSVNHLMFHMVVLILGISAAIFLLCAFYAKRLTERLVAPIEKMADNIMMLDEDAVYDEMKPFAVMIKQQHVDILKHAQIRQEFSANVSHELKTPLTAISGYAELIENGMTGTADTAHFAGEIHRSAERLQNLINDIIKLSELDSSDLKLEFESIDLYEMAKNCIVMLDMTAEKNEVTLSVEGGHVPMMGNKTLIDELLYNLCSNAVRYNKPGGSVMVITKIEKEHPVLIVRDTGIGIPKESQSRIFERFYRVDKSRSKSTGGTGLGLAIVKHIVAQHDAQIFLESEEGVGTEIRVVF